MTVRVLCLWVWTALVRWYNLKCVDQTITPWSWLWWDYFTYKCLCLPLDNFDKTLEQLFIDWIRWWMPDWLFSRSTTTLCRGWNQFQLIYFLFVLFFCFVFILFSFSLFEEFDGWSCEIAQCSVSGRDAEFPVLLIWYLFHYLCLLPIDNSIRSDSEIQVIFKTPSNWSKVSET